MDSDEYWYVARGREQHIVRIAMSPRDTSWAVYLDDRLIGDGYGSPEEAALCINKKDFSGNAVGRLFNGIYAPADVHAWRTSPPEKPQEEPKLDTQPEGPKPDCKGRLWRACGL